MCGSQSQSFTGVTGTPQTASSVTHTPSSVRQTGTIMSESWGISHCCSERQREERWAAGGEGGAGDILCFSCWLLEFCEKKRWSLYIIHTFLLPQIITCEFIHHWKMQHLLPVWENLAKTYSFPLHWSHWITNMNDKLIKATKLIYSINIYITTLTLFILLSFSWLCLTLRLSHSKS